MSGKFSEAVRLAQDNLKDAKGDPSREAQAYKDTAGLLEKAGLYEEAFRAVSQSLRLSEQARQAADGGRLPYLPTEQRADLFRKGRIQAKMKSLEDARKTAEELKAVIEKSIYPRESAKYEHILGLIEVAGKDHQKAAGYFESAISRLQFETRNSSDHALFIDALAQARYGSGDFEKARGEYEKITLLTSGRENHSDIYARAFYWLGKIAEQQGDKTRARESYGKFLDLWKNADPGLPEVEDARKRLSAITRP
jgi:tetratricopeptide (TPR) repeat protein